MRNWIVIATLLFIAALPTYVSGQAAVPEYEAKIIHTYPHKKDASTEGLFYLKGFLYEGTAPKSDGHLSSIREVDLETGHVLRKQLLDSKEYGEGIVNWGNQVFQITESDEKGFIYGLDKFDPQGSFPYKGHGWGLTQDGTRFIVSDGTKRLRFWDLATRKDIGFKDILYLNDRPLVCMNALSWINREVYANIYKNNWVARISLDTGRLTGWFDLQPVQDSLPPENKDKGVANGIAYDDVHHRMFVTGKNWSRLFEIQLKEKDHPKPPPPTELSDCH